MYRGRFAPTPSGPLHAGSLLTAVASWLDARAAGGQWWVRVDDLDQARAVPGAAATQLRQLEQHGLCWDGTVQYQSQRCARYQAAVEELLAAGHAFYCSLSRKDLSACGGLHPGAAAAQPVDLRDAAVRLRVPAQPHCIHDRLQGDHWVDLSACEGPFVIRRRDGIPAYQLACALDDVDDGMTDVLRGIDLLDSTHRQCLVMEALGCAPPRYGHLPVVVDRSGHKLSKSAGAAALSTDVSANLMQTLQRLRLAPPAALTGAPVAELLAWALPHWQSECLCGLASVPAD